MDLPQFCSKFTGKKQFVNGQLAFFSGILDPSPPCPTSISSKIIWKAYCAASHAAAAVNRWRIRILAAGGEHVVSTAEAIDQNLIAHTYR